MMTDEERTEALERAHRIYQDPDAPRPDNLLAVALLEATEEASRLAGVLADIERFIEKNRGAA
jgi:hypothetical protein